MIRSLRTRILSGLSGLASSFQGQSECKPSLLQRATQLLERRHNCLKGDSQLATQLATVEGKPSLWAADVEHEVDSRMAQAMHVVGFADDARNLLELTHHFAACFSGHARIKASARNDEWTCRRQVLFRCAGLSLMIPGLRYQQKQGAGSHWSESAGIWKGAASGMHIHEARQSQKFPGGAPE